MVRVFVLHPEKSSSSDSPSKAHVVHVILLIIVIWCWVDKLKLEILFFYLAKKKYILRLGELGGGFNPYLFGLANQPDTEIFIPIYTLYLLNTLFYFTSSAPN